MLPPAQERVGPPEAEKGKEDPPFEASEGACGPGSALISDLQPPEL